jgi:hypothetical protein
VRAVFFFCFTSLTAFSQSVGDIAFDPKTDDPKFQLCNPDWVWQSYSLKTMMDETSITVAREIRSKFISKPGWEGESGIIRIRFIVNCNGVADRFRALTLDLALKEKPFSNDLTEHLIQIAKEVQWPVRRARQQTVDYYHYFSVRIVDGRLNDVLQ